MAQNHANSPLLRSSRPVSCHFCRSRKLRCSRQLPCDNCSARGIICQLYGAATQTSTPSRRSGRKRTAIVSRLHKPENVVESSQFVQTAVEIAPSTTSTPVTDGNALPRRIVSVNDAEWLERENVDQSSAVSPSSFTRRHTMTDMSGLVVVFDRQDHLSQMSHPRDHQNDNLHLSKPLRPQPANRAGEMYLAPALRGIQGARREVPPRHHVYPPRHPLSVITKPGARALQRPRPANTSQARPGGIALERDCNHHLLVVHSG